MKRPRLPRWLKRLAWVGVWLLTLLTLVLAIENWLGARAWRAYVAEAAATGESMDPKSIIPPPAPDGENFATIPMFRSILDYRRAAPNGPGSARTIVWRDPVAKERLEKLQPLPAGVALTGDWRKGEFTDLAALEKQLRTSGESASTGPVGSELQSRMMKFNPEIEELRAGAPRPRSRFPVNYEDHLDAMLPQADVLRTLTRITQLRALAGLSLGEIDVAHGDLLLGLRLARALEEEPMFISELVQISQVELMLQPIWEGLVRRQWTDAQLVALDSALHPIDFTARFQNGIRGERLLFVIRTLDAAKRQPVILDRIGGPGIGSRLWRPFGPLATGWIDFNKTHTVRYTDKLLHASDPSTHRFHPEIMARTEREFAEEIASSFANPRKGLAQALFPVMKSVMERCAAIQASVDLARCAITLERFRLARGALPETLAELVPAFLTHVPTDVMSGEPLRYRRVGSEAAELYSVGWNGKDDGGAFAWKKDPKRPRVDWQQGDWPWPKPIVR